eukprot:Sspe_Gene.91416::Locus_62915_Transcript_1_1_Confidence_1.000_Length_1065::g.91416::m.91416
MAGVAVALLLVLCGAAAGSDCRGMYSDEAGCTGNASCIWSKKQPPVCESNPCRFDESECERRGCVLDPSTRVCRKPTCLEHTTRKDCMSSTECFYSIRLECVQDGCWFRSKESDCNADPGCVWSPSQETCRSSPCSIRSVYSIRCDMLASCVQDGPRCIEADCSSYANGTCSRMNHCAWIGGKCVGKAAEGCPRLAVVFVVDGSERTRRPFAGHPEGMFVGMVDLLKRWTRQAHDEIKVGVVVAGGNGTVSLGDALGVSSAVGDLESSAIPSSPSAALADAVGRGAGMLRGVSTGEKAVVVLAGGPFTDLAAAQKQVASLGGDGTKVFGVVGRRGWRVSD